MTDRKTHSQRTAAARAGFSERTGCRFDADATLPSQRQVKRGRTVSDPLEDVWDTNILPILEKDTSVKSITLLRHIQNLYPLRFPDDRVKRTLERRVQKWRALNGPEKDIIFRQTPDPGYMGQSDFTDAAELGITIAEEPLVHRLYHFVLVYSRWEHVGVVLGGESFTALAENLQNALWSLGGAPENHRTDSLSAAFRNLSAEEKEDITKRYSAFTEHYGMEASRNNRGVSHENGAIESHHGHLKTAIKQALILRGSNDFATLGEYRHFLDELVARRNKHRDQDFQTELKYLKALPSQRTTDYTEVVSIVTKTSGFLVKHVFYSAPSRLIGQRLRVHVYDDRIEAYLGNTHVVSHPRERAHGKGYRIHVINYHHVIHALKRKPQALANSIYRDNIFPRTEYALAWALFQKKLSRRDACREMVGLLFLAHEEACEAELAHLISREINAGRLPCAKKLGSNLRQKNTDLPPDIPVDQPSLSVFDTLLLEGRA